MCDSLNIYSDTLYLEKVPIIRNISHNALYERVTIFNLIKHFYLRKRYDLFANDRLFLGRIFLS